MERLGSERVTHLLVEGGGEVHASFLAAGCAHEVAFFFAPKVIGGALARKGVAGDGAKSPKDIWALEEVQWRRLGPDLLLRGRLAHPAQGIDVAPGRGLFY
jgi:diaminohydroxyphosphoribosylaminopyrimidine deaminase/5-amino-6-(5-phosphoribosylamino)uracil reductase